MILQWYTVEDLKRGVRCFDRKLERKKRRFKNVSVPNVMETESESVRTTFTIIC